MKQVFCFLLILALLIVSFGCFAEETAEFSFRNGIHFGDSPEIIQEKEGANRFYYDSDSYGNRLMYYYDMTLSGISKSNLYYCFKNDLLNAVKITYGYNERVRTSDYEALNLKYEEEYGIIEKGLEQKYGATDELKDFSGIKFYYGSCLFERIDEPEHIIKATQRIIEIDNEHKIYIDHALLDGSHYGKKYCTHHLTYVYVNLSDAPIDVVLQDL